MIELAKELLCQVVWIDDVHSPKAVYKIERSDLDKMVDPLSRNFGCCRKCLCTLVSEF